jgi:amino acid permease
MNFHLMSPCKEALSRIFLRTFVLLCIIAVAMAVPFFGDFLSLVSAISTIAMVFVLPVLFYVVLARRNKVHIPIWHLV